MAGDLFDVESDEKGETSIVLRIVTEPGAGRPSLVARDHDGLRIRVSAAPRSERADRQCVELVADVFGVDAADVEIVSGISAPKKRLKVRGVSQPVAHTMLERAIKAATRGARNGSR